MFCADLLQQGARLLWSECNGTQVFEYLPISSDVLWAFDVNPSHQALNIHHSGHSARELEDVERTAHRRMRTAAVRDDAGGDIGPLRHRDEPVELGPHHLGAA